MSIITLPSKFGFTQISKFQLDRAGNEIRSPYTGSRQVVIYPYAVWIVEGDLVQYDGADASAIRSFLVKLEGNKNSFRLPVPAYTAPSTGVVVDAAVKTSAAARATSITLKSLPVSTPIFAEGDYFTIQDELKIVTGAVSSNGSGEVTVSFLPGLRVAAAADVAVKLQNPTVLLNWQDDGAATWAINPPARYPVKFKAIESV